MAKLNIALVEPEIPQNTGNIARTCPATGAALHLIKPLGFSLDDRQMKRAGLDYWDKLDVTLYEDLDEFLSKTLPAPKFFYTTKAPRRHTEVLYPEGCFLVFGKETAGLPEALLESNQDSCVRIPMRESLRSLNLSNSVAIVLYESLRQNNFMEAERNGQLHRLYSKDLLLEEIESPCFHRVRGDFSDAAGRLFPRFFCGFSFVLASAERPKEAGLFHFCS